MKYLCTASQQCKITSNTIINTAGPEQLSALKFGLLSMYLKDSKGNLHQMLAENYLVIQSLSQNLTSHTQFVEQGHLVYFHNSGLLMDLMDYSTLKSI